MKRPKLLAAIVAAGAAVFAFAGCFAFSGINYSKTKVRPGTAEQSITKVTTQVMPAESTTRRFFVLIGLPNTETEDNRSDDPLRVLAKGAKFDTKSVFLNKPRPMVTHDQLAELYEGNGSCGSLALPPNTELHALVTKGKVDSSGPKGRRAHVFHRLRQVRDSEGLNPARIYTVVGSWNDENTDNTATFAETACHGGAYSALHLRLAPAAKHAKLTAEERAYLNE